MVLESYKADFLEAAIGGGILKFGSFLLKSGRASPYFFNAGEFYTSKLARALETAYAKAVMAAQVSGALPEFDVVFGPAYKGIPLAYGTVAELGRLDARFDDACYSFDRKEIKDHGEGGNMIGAPLRGRKVLIVDDVVTAGMAKREAIGKIQREGGKVVGIVVALDRMEKLPAPDGNDAKPMPSAIGALRKEYGVPIVAILTLDDIIAGMGDFASAEDIKRTKDYRARYKASD